LWLSSAQKTTRERLQGLSSIQMLFERGSDIFQARQIVSARNGIMMISHYQHLREEGVPFGRELILRGAQERVAPILMTACAHASRGRGLGLSRS
jgi:Cu/Ag efflux pump CusA